ncbi:MAG TPA: hypothetical protein ENK18_01385 [Deltaproteobacteria bacterium]|nr:hypothetical protein [Deltaproteobacteria bacterium]
MSRPILVPNGHEALKILRSVSQERLVLRTRRRSGDCTTLVLLTPVPLHFGPTLKGVVLRGRGSIEGLPAEVSRTLEGFRVRARVGLEDSIARVVDAGVLQPSSSADVSGPRPPPGHGFAWVATAWVPGETLDKRWPDLSPQEQHRALLEIAEGIATLHRYGVFYGDLKPGNVILTDEGAVLIDLETLREVPGVDAPVRCLEYTPGYAAPEQEALYEAYLTSDLWSFGALASSQLTGLPPGEAVRAVSQGPLTPEIAHRLPPPWLDVLRACLRPMPQARPRASAVAAVLRGERVGLEGFMDPPSAPRFNAFVKVDTPQSADVEETTRVDDPTPPVGMISQPPAPASPAPGPPRSEHAVVQYTPTLPRGPLSDLTIPDPDLRQPTAGPSHPPPPPREIVTVMPRDAEALKATPVVSYEPTHSESFEAMTPVQPSPPAIQGGGGRRNVARLAGALFTLGFVAMCWFGGTTAFGRFQEARQARARERGNAYADTVLTALKRHKTDPIYNGQEEIERVLAAAREATAVAQTPDTLGVAALALVWSQRWHYSTASWDPEAWALADEETARAVDTRATPYGALARAMALSAACRLMPTKGRERGRRCRAAQRRFRDATDQISILGEESWLAVEAHWAAEMLEAHLALEAYRQENLGEARRRAAAALEHCEAAWPALDSAPVNGDELNEDCIGVAGWAQDYEAYLRWSDRLLTRRDRTQASSAAPELARIFRGGGLPCAFRDVGSDGRPTSKSQPGSWGNLCDYVGLLALGCVDEATKARRCESRVLGVCTRYARDAGVPWDAALKVSHDPYRTTCLLD